MRRIIRKTRIVTPKRVASIARLRLMIYLCIFYLEKALVEARRHLASTFGGPEYIPGKLLV
jgi:hypothetical protein